MSSLSPYPFEPVMKITLQGGGQRTGTRMERRLQLAVDGMEVAMKRIFIVIAAAGAFALPAFASEAGQGDEAAAAQRAKLVTSVQAELGVAPADGKIGPQTHAAVKEFERSKGLDPTGQLD